MKIKNFIAGIVASTLTFTSSFIFEVNNEVYRHKQTDIIASAEAMNYDNTNMEMEASDSIGKLLMEAVTENENLQEENGDYLISDLTLDVSTGEINIELSNIDFCNILVGFYNDDGTELITSVTQEVTPISNSAQLNVDMKLLPDYYLIKAYLLDVNQLPLSNAYICNTYTEIKQSILSATIYDFDEKYVVNLNEDVTTDFLVLNKSTVIINSTETENVLINADYENGNYVYTNCNEELTGLQVGDIFYHQNGNETIVDKVGSITYDGSTVTISSAGTDLKEAFEFIKIESDSSDFEVIDIDESKAENCKMISGGKNVKEETAQNSKSYNNARANYKGEGYFWDSFKFIYTIGEDKLYSKKSDDNEDLKSQEGVTASGTITVTIDPHINAYWSITKAYFEINCELDTNADFKAGLDGSYTGQICKFDSISIGGNGIYFKIEPVIEVFANAKINLDITYDETFGFYFDTKRGYESRKTLPEIKSNELKCSGEIGIDINFQPKLYIITDKAANIKLDAKVGVKATAETTLPIYNSTTIHECDSCIGGNISFFIKLSVSGSVLDDTFTLRKDILDKTIPICNYYFSETFDEFALTKCPHYKLRQKFTVLNEKRKPVNAATIAIDRFEVFRKLGFEQFGLDSVITLKTDSNGTAEIWYPKSYSSTVPIKITVSYDGYDPTEKSYQFKGDSKDFKFHIYPEGYIGAFFEDIIGMLKGDDDLIPETTTSVVTEPIVTTATTVTVNSGEIIDSGECGDNLTWTLDDNGMLVISGNGKMSDYIIDEMPWWYNKRTSVKNVIIENGVTSIGKSAFYGCVRLTNIEIPNSVEEIGAKAFFECKSLESIKIPNSVTTIRIGAFLWCSGLTSIEIPDSITSIESGAFSACKSLTSIEIPDSVTSIESGAFSDCTSLTSVEIPDSVTLMESRAFANCNSLTNIYVSENNENYSSIDGVLFNKDKTKLIQYAIGKENSEYIIPNSVTSIEDAAFLHCKNLTILDIPNSVTSIGDVAFYGCSNLSDVYYTGTKEEWKKINISSYGNGHEHLTSATIHYNSSSPLIQTMSFKTYQTAAAKSNLKTYKYTNGVPFTEYLLLAVKDTETENVLSANNLLYIDQQTADKSGNVTFNYVAPDDCKYIFIGDFGKGEYCRIAAMAISTDVENCTICGNIPDEKIYGDANGDGVVNVRDAAFIARMISQGKVKELPENADYNGDGVVNVRDAAAIARDIASRKL